MYIHVRGLTWMQGTHECIVQGRVNLPSEWEDFATLAREMHVHKSLVSYP